MDTTLFQWFHLNAHLDVLPRCRWSLDERKWSWGNLRCCIQWYQQHVKWEGVAKGNARFPHGDHSFTAAVHIAWYHRGSKHWRRTGNGMQHTNRSYVGWLLHYPHLLSPPVRSYRAGRWLAPAHVLSETHPAILFRKFPLELCSIHTLVHPKYGCKSTTSYQWAVSHRCAYLSTCSLGMECCLRRSIRGVNIQSVWQIEGRPRGHQSLCWPSNGMGFVTPHVWHIGIGNGWDVCWWVRWKSQQTQRKDWRQENASAITQLSGFYPWTCFSIG